MGASKTEILYALENSMFEFPELPGQWKTPPLRAFEHMLRRIFLIYSGIWLAYPPSQ